MNVRLGGLGAPLALVALALVCFARLVAEPGALLVDGERPSLDDTQRADQRSVGNDLTRLFLPHHLRIAEQIDRLGRLPLWDPFGFGGRPRAGNPQAGLWYPPVWPAWWSGSPAVLGWLTVGHLLWGGLGAYGLARSLAIGRWGALVAAGCFQASPYLLAQAFEGHYPHVWAASWYPWAFRATLAMRRGDPKGALALPPILALALLAGHPQESYYLAFALGLWAAADAVVAARGGSVRAACVRLGAWAGVSALALGLAAVELVPDLEAGSWALRSGQLGLKQASHYHLSPINLLQLLSPRALGGPADYVGHDNYWETVLSIGWVPLVLVAMALARSPRRGLVRAWATLTALAVAFAAGRRLGLFALLYELVPGMGQFRVPARSLFLATLGASVLAGLGVEAVARPTGDPAGDWRRTERRNRRWLALLVVVLLAGRGAARSLDVDQALRAGVGRVGVGSEPRWPESNRSRELIRWIMAASRIAHDPVFWVALTGSAVAIAWGRRRPDDRRRVAWALGLLALLELGAQGHGLIKTAPPGPFLGPDPVSEALARAGPPGPWRLRARDDFYTDLRAVRHGFEKTNAHDYFQIQHAADLYQELYRLFGPDPGRPARAVRQAVLDRMNVALVVTDRPVPRVDWPVVGSGTSEGATYLIYRNPTALPRAYVVPHALPAPDDASAVARFRTVDPREAVLLSSADPLGRSGPRQPFTTAEYDAADPDRVVVRVETEAAGLLVVADTWMPGWTARVDGRPAPILRGNHAQRVIPLPRPGRHLVVMTYRPPGLALGLVLTGSTGLIWFSALAWTVWSRGCRASTSMTSPRGPTRRVTATLASPVLDD